MRKTFCLFFILLSLFQSFSFAASSEYQNSLSSTFYAYQSLCGKEAGLSPVPAQVSAICKIVTKSSLCRDVEREDLLRCDDIQNSSQFSFWEMLQGCGEGVVDFLSEIPEMIWQMLRWSWSHVTSSEARRETYDEASEYMGMIKLYVYTEYAKAKADSSNVFEALAKLNRHFSHLFLKSLQNYINQKYASFGCLNFEAKSQVVCQAGSEVVGMFATPFGVVKFLGYSKKFKDFSKLKLQGLWDSRKIGASGRTYEVKEMQEKYKKKDADEGEDKDVVYFSAIEREKFKVYVKEGRLVNSKGEPLNITNTKAIYVMDAEGNIYIHPKAVMGKIHHSSLLAGSPMAAGGDIRIVNGLITQINNRSGHYHPTPEMMGQMLDELEVRGTNLEKLEAPEVYEHNQDFWESDAPERWGF